jgi:hypothetical protein
MNLKKKSSGQRREEMLAYLDLKSISPSTAWNWLDAATFSKTLRESCGLVDISV